MGVGIVQKQGPVRRVLGRQRPGRWVLILFKGRGQEGGRWYCAETGTSEAEADHLCVCYSQQSLNEKNLLN